MGCGASKDGAGGVTGDKPNKNSDPMVISLWRKRPRGRPVCQVAKRLIQAEVALRLSMIWRWRGVGGRTGRSLSSCLFRTQVINLEGQKNDPRLNDLRFNLATTAVLTRTPRRRPYRPRVPASCVNLLRAVRTEAQGSLPRAASTARTPYTCRTYHVPRPYRVQCPTRRARPTRTVSVPRTVAPQAIRELNISQCELEHLPEQIALLTSLLTLNVSQNRHAPHAQSAG